MGNRSYERPTDSDKNRKQDFSAKQEFDQIISKLRGGLIVSCQASAGEPLCHPSHIKAMAQSVIAGGAIGLRLEGIENIKAVREVVSQPIIGLIKSASVSDKDRLKQVYITARFEDASHLAGAGADIIAIDATGRPRPDKLKVIDLIEKIHKELKKPVLADIATINEGLAAFESGADMVSTTLYGYTEETKLPFDAGPGLDLLAELIQKTKKPVILEGRVWKPEQMEAAFIYGAFAVIVGSAITRPQLITQRFVQMLKSVNSMRGVKAT